LLPTRSSFSDLAGDGLTLEEVEGLRLVRGDLSRFTGLGRGDESFNSTSLLSSELLLSVIVVVVDDGADDGSLLLSSSISLAILGRVETGVALEDGAVVMVRGLLDLVGDFSVLRASEEDKDALNTGPSVDSLTLGPPVSLEEGLGALVLEGEAPFLEGGAEAGWKLVLAMGAKS
jgi:hypothetical protein